MQTNLQPRRAVGLCRRSAIAQNERFGREMKRGCTAAQRAAMNEAELGPPVSLGENFENSGFGGFSKTRTIFFGRQLPGRGERPIPLHPAWGEGFSRYPALQCVSRLPSSCQSKVRQLGHVLQAREFFGHDGNQQSFKGVAQLHSLVFAQPLYRTRESAGAAHFVGMDA